MWPKKRAQLPAMTVPGRRSLRKKVRNRVSHLIVKLQIHSGACGRHRWGEERRALTRLSLRGEATQAIGRQVKKRIARRERPISCREG